MLVSRSVHLLHLPWSLGFRSIQQVPSIAVVCRWNSKGGEVTVNRTRHLGYPAGLVELGSFNLELKPERSIEHATVAEHPQVPVIFATHAATERVVSQVCGAPLASLASWRRLGHPSRQHLGAEHSKQASLRLERSDRTLRTGLLAVLQE